MLKRIVNEFAYGIAQALVVSHGRSYVVPPEKSFPLDAANLRRDANELARGLNRQFKK